MSATKIIRARLGRAVLGAAAIASFASAQPARAAEAREENAPPSDTAVQKTKPADVLPMIDTDKKGYVTREEFLKFNEAVLERIDGNEDRRANEVEFTDRG